MKVRRDDRVRVMTGKDRGVTGRVIKVDPRRNRLIVEGVNRVKRHERMRPAQGRQGVTGGITEKEAWINASNVQVVCSDCERPTRIGYEVEDGTKRRVCRKCGAKL